MAKGTGSGSVVTLQIMAVVDFLAALAMVKVALVAGWPVVGDEGPYWFETGGLSGLWVLGALVLRLSALGVMAQWAGRLPLPPGRSSAVQDWFVPGVSLFAPLQVLLSANPAAGSRLLILTWWLARWLTCASGFVVTIMVLGALFPGPSDEESNSGTVYLGWLAIAALIAKPLEFAVVTLTHHRQSRRPGLATDHF